MSTATASVEMLDLLREFGDQVILTKQAQELRAPWYERKALAPTVRWEVRGLPGAVWHVCTVEVVDDKGCIYWVNQVHQVFRPGDAIEIDFTGRFG